MLLAWMTSLHVVAATALYWLLLFSVWYAYTTRPSVQAKARERDFRSASVDPETGHLIAVHESSVNVVRVVMVVMGPPALLGILGLIARGGS